MRHETKSKATLPPDLLWLADAPLFIDTRQVERFYDAVVRPETREGTTTLHITKETVENINRSFGFDVKLSPGELAAQLSTVFAFINPSVGLSAQVGKDRKTATQQSQKIELHPISTPERQLIQLVLHYLINQPHRLFFAHDAKTSQGPWCKASTLTESPRALLFLDLPGEYDTARTHQPRTKLIPTAMEVEGGKVEPLYDKLSGQTGQPPPPYPKKATSEKTLPDLRRDYWKWFDDHFDPSSTIEKLEAIIEKLNKPIRWIDFRVPLTEAGDTLHLHIVNTGNHDTGTFAYNFIKRGYKHGVRLVGTLKSEPDMNVLAIYEK